MRHTERTVVPTVHLYRRLRCPSMRALAVGGMLSLTAVTMTGCTKAHPGATPTSAQRSGGTATIDAGSSSRVLIAGHGIEIVSLTDAQDERSPVLYATTDMVHWRPITPPALAKPTVISGSQPYFDEFISASFLNPLTGWVVACDQANSNDVIYQTADGGQTWQTVLDGGGTNRCLVSIQLLAAGVAILDLQTNGYVIGVDGIVDLTDDDGQTWQSLFTVPDGVQLPQVTPVVFADRQHGFSAGGFVAFTNIGSPGNGYFQTSRDGGRTWSAQSPPSPGGHVIYDLPTFVDAQNGVLPALGNNGPAVRLQFDTTTDGGATWHEHGSLPIETSLTGDYQYPYSPYPAVSVASMNTWWVAQGTKPVSLSVTVDAGGHWTTIAPEGLPATPTRLDAIDGTTALATVPRGTPGNPDYRFTVYLTNDAGAHWTTITP